MSVSLLAAGPHCAMPASNTIRASAYSSTSAQLLAKISHGSAPLLDSAVARRVFLASLIRDSSTGLGAFAPKPRDAGAAAGFFFFCLVFCLASIAHTGCRAIGAGIRSAEAAASSAAVNSKKRCIHSRRVGGGGTPDQRERIGNVDKACRVWISGWDRSHEGEAIQR